MVKRIKFYGVLFFFSFLTICIQAQNGSFGRLSDELSISNITVRTMLQDSKGFLWLGTWYGLYRYDGYNLRKFKVTANLPNENKGSKIVALCEDRNGIIWVATQNTGLYQFDRKTEQFKAFQHDEKDENSIISNNINTVFEDRDGRIWVGTRYGIDLFENNKFRHFKDTPLSKLEVENIIQARDGALWCATSYGVFKCFDTFKGNLTPQMFDMQQPNTPVTNMSYWDNFCFTMLEDPRTSNLFWITTKHGLKKLDTATNQRLSIEPTPNGLIDNTVYTSLLSTENGIPYLWLGTDGGLNRYNILTGVFDRYLADPKNVQSLRNSSIQSLLKDRSGLLWIGTNKGVNKLNMTEKAFEKILLTGENNISCLTKSSHSLWLGTYGNGIHEMPLNNGLGTPKRLQIAGLVDYIYSIHADTEGILWAATRSGGIYKIPINNPNNTQQFSEANSLSDNYIMTLYEDTQRNMWFGTWNHGLVRYNRATNSFTTINTLSNYAFNISEYPIVQFIEFKNPKNERILWVGTRGGGIIELVLDDASNIVKMNAVYQSSPQNSQSLSSNFITCFFTDSSNRIWIGTEEGMSLWDSEKKTFKRFGEKENLPDENIQAIAQDDKGIFWITTNKGLSKLIFDDKQQLIVRNFDEKDGLPSKYYHPAASYLLNGKQLLFGSTNGLLAFNPDDIKDNETVPMVSLVDFKLFNETINVNETKNGRTLLPLSINEIKTINLAYRDNAFSIEFAALHFVEPDKNRYAYRLIGFNNNWIFANANERTAHYTNLPHGKYTFEVKAANNDGVWSTEIARVLIVVSPPFWLTWWAYLFYIGCIGGAIWLYRHTILVQENLKNDVQMAIFKREQSEEVSKMKVRFFTNVSHELRTPLTLILSPLDELTKREDVTPSVQETYALMQRNATRLFNLITELLDFRKTEEGLMTLRVVETDIVKYLTNITIAFKDLARQRNIDFTFVSTLDDLKMWFDRDLMEKVFFNLFSNAFKYSNDGGKIVLKLNLDEQRNAVMSIEDTGIGIYEDELQHIFEEFYRGKTSSEGKFRQGTGIGLALTKNIIDLHKSKISATSNVGEGSKFTITMPLGYEHFDAKFINHAYKSSEDIGEYDAAHVGEFMEENAAKNGGEVLNNTDVDPITPPQYLATENDETPAKQQLLVVEDNPDIRKFIKLYLSHLYDIEEAENGKEGLEKAKKMIPDLIISDILMPEIDGLEMCKILKNNESTAHIPIILLTARSSQLYQIEGYETGADDYVTKPFNTTLLISRIKNLLENRERIQNKFNKGFSQNPTFDVKPSDLNMTHLDKRFLEKCIELVERHMEDSDYSVEQMSTALLMSRMQVYRKIKALTGDTPNHFVRTIRLKRAAQFLEKGFSVSETTYKVGFQDLKYFRECFKTQFGVNPSDFVKK